MQTFLPYPNIVKSLYSLDNRRLNKQLSEAIQIRDTLKGKNKGWTNHPAVKMWKEHKEALDYYILQALRICESKGIDIAKREAKLKDLNPQNYLPSHLTPAFHRSHQSNLLRKGFKDLLGERFKSAKLPISFNQWCKAHCRTTDLSMDNIIQLNNHLNHLGIPRYTKSNHYANFHPTPPDLPYIWPVK